MQRITKAVFPVAGIGSRFLPATKAMPKELLPIIDKPLIQYAVEEAVLAGIETLIFITGRNKRAIEDHFDKNLELEMLLRFQGKDAYADKISNIIPDGVHCVFIRQAEQLGLGHAILCAERVIGNEPFAVLLADDYITGNDTGEIADLLSAYYVTRKTQISTMAVDGPDISNYGVVIPGESELNVQGLIEKPSYREAPSNLASIGRYVLSPIIFEILRGLKPGTANEIQLSDAIDILAKDGFVEAVKLSGVRFDCGSIEGYACACRHEFIKRGFF